VSTHFYTHISEKIDVLYNQVFHMFIGSAHVFRYITTVRLTVQNCACVAAARVTHGESEFLFRPSMNYPCWMHAICAACLPSYRMAKRFVLRQRCTLIAHVPAWARRWHCSRPKQQTTCEAGCAVITRCVACVERGGDLFCLYRLWAQIASLCAGRMPETSAYPHESTPLPNMGTPAPRVCPCWAHIPMCARVLNMCNDESAPLCNMATPPLARHGHAPIGSTWAARCRGTAGYGKRTGTCSQQQQQRRRGKDHPPGVRGREGWGKVRHIGRRAV